MPEDFDPYRKWLGIPPAEQPPDHYQLLGVGRFEDDADTISNAADRQMAHVRTFQTGPHSGVSQKLLNEIAAARVCLLDRPKKAEYDARLHAKLAREAVPPPVAPVAGVLPPRSMPMISAGGSPAGPRPSDDFAVNASIITTTTTRRKRRSYDSLLLGSGVLLLVALVAIVVLARRDRTIHEQAPPRGDLAPQIDKQPIGPVENNHPPAPTAPPTRAGLEILEAGWGRRDRWQDITERMRSLVDGDCLLATADGSLFEGLKDPAFGQAKRVRIRYNLAGKPGESEFNGRAFIYLDGRPAEVRVSSSKGLEVLEARYGAGATWIDALPRLRRWIHGDRLAVSVGQAAIGDLAPNVHKALFLRYRTPDGEFVAHAWDNEELVLDARPIQTVGKPTDLIAAANADRDSTGGKWRKEGKAIVAPDGESGSLPIAVETGGDYLLTAVLAERPWPDNVNITVPIGNRRVQLVVDGWLGGAGRAVSGLQFVDGAAANQNETTRRGRFFDSSQSTTIQCAVRESSIAAMCNGRVVVDFSGDLQRLSLPNKADGNERSVIVGGLGRPWRIERLQVAPLAAALPRAAPASAEVVDLLQHIDPKLDAVHGDWQMTENGLLSPDRAEARIQVPFSPPDDYELRIVAQRVSGKETFLIGLVVDGWQTMMAIDGWGGNVGGLHFLDGKGADRNATRYEGSVFADERPKEIVCMVHPESVRVLCEDHVLVDWHGDSRRLSIDRQLGVPDKLGLALGSWKASFLVSKFELRALPPQTPSEHAPRAAMSKPLETQDATPSKPASPADLVYQPAADTRQAVPQGKELAAAEKQVADTYGSLWEAAQQLPDRQTLARKMYDDGVQTASNQTLRYALLREAEHRATDLGDAATACDAIDQLGRDFQIDPLPEKLTACDEALKKAQSPTQLWTLAVHVLVLADRALVAEQFDDARKLISLTTLAGRRLKRTDLTKYAERRQAMVRSRGEWHDRLEKALARLQDEPDDPAANLSAGIALCLLRGDWQHGLPLLARSGEKRMTEIAGLEAVAGKDAAMRPALVDAWLAEAPNQTGAMRTEFELQAKYWIERGLPEQGPTDSAHKRALDKLAAMPGITLARLKPGLDMAMFNGADFQEFRARRVAEGVCHDFGFRGPHRSVRANGFSIRWTGWLKPPLPGKYVIRTNSDDGCRLRINGKLLIDRWHRGAGEERTEVELTDQLQPIRMEFNDTGVTASIRVAWALKDLSDFQPLPAEALYYDPESVSEN